MYDDIFYLDSFFFNFVLPYKSLSLFPVTHPLASPSSLFTIHNLISLYSFHPIF